MYLNDDIYELSLYFPTRFARQFGYDQLYIGNPYIALVHDGSLVDGLGLGSTLKNCVDTVMIDEHVLSGALMDMLLASMSSAINLMSLEESQPLRALIMEEFSLQFSFW